MADLKSIIGTAAQAVPIVGSIGSIIGGFLDRNQQAKINKQNIAMQRETNLLNYRMFNEANQFSEKMADKQWNREVAYNDPSAQLSRYMAAGINPYNDNTSAVSAGSSNVAAPSSVGAPNMVSPRSEMIESGFSRSIAGFSAVASALGSLASAKKAGIETKQIENSMDEYVRGLQLDNEAKDIANSVNAAFSMQERTAQVAKLHQEVLKTIEDVALAKKQNDGVAIDNAIKHIQKLMEDKRLSYLPKELDQQLRNLKAQEGAINASAAASRASASLSKAQEYRLSQPFQGLNLSDEQKDKLATVMYQASVSDNEARNLLSEIQKQTHRWSQSDMNELLRWMQNAVNDFPVIGPILKALSK